MWLVIVLVTVVLAVLFLVAAARWQHTRVRPIVQEKYANANANDIRPVEVLVQQYNDGLETIQRSLADQNSMIDTIASNTYKRAQIDEMVGDVTTQFENTRMGLNGQLLNLEKEVQGRLHYDVANTTYAKKLDVSNTLNDYAKIAVLDNKVAELNQYAADTYLSKTAATAMYADRGKVFQMDSQLGGLNDKIKGVQDGQQSLFSQLADYATKADMSGYAKYTEFASLNSRVTNHAMDANQKHQTVSKFMADQTQMNLDLLNKNTDMGGKILGLEADHQGLVDELGNYLTADAVNSLLQSSYAPLGNFKLLQGDVDTIESDITSLKTRAGIVEGNLKLKETQLCLKDPMSKQDVCMMGADFSFLRNIMDEYYKDQEQDAERLAELERRRQEAEKHMRTMEQELKDSESRRQLMARQNADERDKLRQETAAKDAELQRELTRAILEVQGDADRSREEMQAKLVAEEQKLEVERKRLSDLNSNLSGLQQSLASVQEQDINQSREISRLGSMIPVLEEQKKNLELTVREKSDIIQDLTRTIAEQEAEMERRMALIIVREEQLEICGLARDKCVVTDLPGCRANKVVLQEEIGRLEGVVFDLDGKLETCNYKYGELDEQYKALDNECRPKITQDFCDAQQRTLSRQTLYRNNEPLFSANFIMRNISDSGERNRVDKMLKQNKVNEIRDQWTRQKPTEVPKLSGYPTTELNLQSQWRWETTPSDCPDFESERRRLQNLLDTEQFEHNTCKTKLDTCNTDYGVEIGNHGVCKTDRDDYYSEKKQCDKDLEDALKNKCMDCNYMGGAFGKVDETGVLINHDTIRQFCYKDADHLSRLQQGAGGGSWAPVTVMHKPNCDAEIDKLRNQQSTAPKWVKYHGYPNGMVSLSTTTMADQAACKVACDQNPSCSLYTYNISTKKCELKSSIPVFEA